MRQSGRVSTPPYNKLFALSNKKPYRAIGSSTVGYATRSLWFRRPFSRRQLPPRNQSSQLPYN
jgi:hypothetical protein